MSENCEKMQDKIADYVIGALSQEHHDALNEHIVVCSKCRQYLQSLKAEKSLLVDFAKKLDEDMETREEKVLQAIKHCKSRERISLLSICRAIVQSKITKLTVAAALLIAVGYFAGQLISARAPDVQQLQTALETSLKLSLEQTIHQSLLEQVNRDRELALERHYVRLRDELTRQLHHNMSEFAAQTLAASQAVTDQRLAELIRLIEAIRTVDHYQVRMALEQIESNRLQDKTHFGNGLVSLAAQTNKELPNNQQ